MSVGALMASEVLTLDNEYKSAVVFEQDTNLPIVSMQLVFQQSGAIEDGKKPGLAKLVAKLLGEGTKKMGSAAFAEALESKAIHLSASNGTETFVFELSSLKEEFAEGVKAFQSLLQDPNFTQEALDRIKTKMIGALMQKENDYDFVANRELKKLLFEKTSLANPASGTVESLKEITLDDVITFYREHIVQAKAIAVIGGDLSAQEAKSFAHELIAVLPQGTEPKLVSAKVRETPKEITVTRDTQQAYIYFGSPFYLDVDSSDYYKARVALYILGTGGFGTRLMEEIRVKRGLAYSAYARMSVNRSHAYVTGYLQTKIESGEEALKIVKSEFERFVKEGVTQKELDAAREFLLGSEPLRTETLSQRLSRTFLNFYRELPFDATQRELDAIASLRLEDLNSFIKQHDEILDLSVVTLTK